MTTYRAVRDRSTMAVGKFLFVPFLPRSLNYYSR